MSHTLIKNPNEIHCTFLPHSIIIIIFICSIPCSTSSGLCPFHQSSASHVTRDLLLRPPLHRILLHLHSLLLPRRTTPGASTSHACGVDPHVLTTCPVTYYSTIKMRTPQNPAFQCAVCLAEFNNADDALHLLSKCGHVFHAHCIDAWLAAHVTCPVCRGEVSVEIEGEARARHVFEESSVRGFGVLLRSHSTGHSLERFTLRMPEEVMKKILEDSERGNVTRMMKRSASYDVVLRSMEGGWVRRFLREFQKKNCSHCSTTLSFKDVSLTLRAYFCLF